MRIVIDARNADGSGIYRYSRKLVEYLQAVDTEHEYVVLTGRAALSTWHFTAPNFRGHAADQPIYSLGEQTALLGALRTLKADLVHFTSFNAPVLYGGRRVTTVHDLTYLEFPSLRDPSPLGRLRYRAKDLAMRTVLQASLRRSSAVITDTRYVREELLRRYGGKAVSADRTYAIHCGAGEGPRGEANGDLPDGVRPPYLLYVGHGYPHKNLRSLIDALAIARRECPDLQLVLVGRPDSFYESLREYATARSGVVFPGFVADGTLGALYRHASLFVLPSFSEGFGLPALEAMAHGTPVLSSRATCLPEVCGDAAEYFDPADVHEMARKAVTLMRSPADTERLRAGGLLRAGEFSWRRMAEETLGVYETVLAGR
jgi:glycosyltransferase involved in cell wall biosynthesis